MMVKSKTKFDGYEMFYHEKEECRCGHAGRGHCDLVSYNMIDPRYYCGVGPCLVEGCKCDWFVA